MKYFITSVLFLSTLIISGCSSKSAKDYMQSAHENMMNKKMSQAITDYETVAEEYSKSPEAPEALFQIATMYQNKMVENISEKDSYKKASDTFREIFDKYPENEKAPVALFLSGFILDNDLMNYQAATLTYNLFLSKYPKHELATSAQAELNNMGLSPDQILQKQAQKNI